MKKMMTLICCLLALAVSLTACAQPNTAQVPVATEAVSLAQGGTIVLCVNPQIAVEYDNEGLVTGITAKNDDAFAVLANYKGFQNKPARTVVAELVSVIGEAGYFVEDVDGEYRRIVLEIEPGSAIPHEAFVDDVVREIQKIIKENNWYAPLNLEGVSDYGITDYAATDYGTTDYGTTDYAATDYATTDYAATDYATTDYAATDYGATDYGATDYGATDYGATDYGTTDYGTTDYATTDYAATDYHESDYGESDYGDSAYSSPAPTAAPAPAPTAAPIPSYGGGDSGYSDYSDYGADSGYSDYSDYGES